MSCPVVTGAAACLTQHFRNRVQGADPAASMMKGLLIHTARHGGAGRGPNYRFGWGLLDARAAADFITALGRGGTWLDRDAIADQSVEYPCESNGLEAIQVTLAWTDWPGIPTSGNIQYDIPNLVNDLDLSITGPDGNHYPWTLDPEHPSDPARQDRENHRDNIEQVYIEAPAPGTYIIRVGGQVNAGDQQTYDLCVTGLRKRGNYPALCILKPFNQSLIEGVFPVQVLIIGLEGPSRLQTKVDGKPWDDPATPELEGDRRIDPVDDVYHGALPWNTRLLINGDHRLELIVTDSEGRSRAKRLQVWVFNSGSGLTVNGPRVTGFLHIPGQVDSYVLRVPEAGYYTVETHPVENRPEVDTVLFLCEADDDGGYEKYSKLTCELTTGRMYSVTVSGFENSLGYYCIDVKPATGGEDTPPYIPLEIDGPPVETAFLDYGGPHLYVIRQEKMELVVIQALPGFPVPTNFQFTLSNVTQPAQSTLYGTFQNAVEVILLKDCIYHLRVEAFKSKGVYTIQVNRVKEPENQKLLIVDDPPLQAAFRPRMQYRFMPLESGNHILTIQPDPGNGYVNFHARLYPENDFVNSLHRWFDSTRRSGFSDPAKTTLFAALRGWNVYYVTIESEVSGGTYAIQVRKAQREELPIVAERHFASKAYHPGTPLDVAVQVQSQALPGNSYYSTVLYEYCPSDWLPAGSVLYPYLPPLLRFRMTGEGTQSVTYRLFPPGLTSGPLHLEGQIYFYTIEGINSMVVEGDSVLYPAEGTGIEGWRDY